jgi:hypothetical protein
MNSLKQTTLTPNDPNWDKTMIQYGSVAGRPAFASGVYEDPRSTAKTVSMIKRFTMQTNNIWKWQNSDLLLSQKSCKKICLKN